MVKENSELDSSSVYLVSNWKKIMPRELRLVNWNSKEEITPKDCRYPCSQRWMLKLEDRMVGSFRWEDASLTPKEIRALKGLDFEELNRLYFQFGLDADNAVSGFRVLPPNLGITKGLYNFGAEIIDSYCLSKIPPVFHASCEGYNPDHEECGLNYEVGVEGLPTTRDEIAGLGQFVGQIGSLRDKLMHGLKLYVSAEKRFQREIRKSFAKSR